MDKNHRIINADVLTGLKQLPDESVQCVVTSPPYWGLRNYNNDGQIGLEETPEEYVAKMVQVFREVRRVLRNDGTLFLNLGDTYAGGGRGGDPKHHKGDNSAEATAKSLLKHSVIKPKDLVGIPWRVAFALQADGWWLRQDIIWHKPNPMPESVTDRCTKSHEYMFLLTKSAKYYYDADAIAEDAKYVSISGMDKTGYKDAKKYNGKHGNNHKNLQDNGQQNHSFHESRADGLPDKQYPVRNKRSVWTVNTKPYKEAHFAVFPPNLIKPCVLAGSKKGDIVLDPFAGSGTTAFVAKEYSRKSIMIELNPEYCKLIKDRLIQEVLPL